MAAGLKIKPENIARFRSVFERSVIEKTVDLQIAAEITIDRELKLKEISERLIDDIGALRPFGNGNDEPLFMARRVQVKQSRIVGERHRQMILVQSDNTAGGRPYSAIQFNIDPKRPVPKSFDRIAFRLQWNRWNGRKEVQLLVEETEESTA